MPGIHGLLTLAVSVVVLTALYVGREVFLPMTLAILLAFVIAPFMELLRRLHLSRVPSVILSMLVVLGILGSLGSIIGYQLAGLASDLPRYQTTIKAKMSSLHEGALGRLPEIIRSIGTEFQRAVKEPPAPPETAPQAGPAEPSPLPVEVHEPNATPLEMAQSILVPAVKPLATLGIVLVVLIFILLQREDLRDRMIRLFGANDLHRTTLAMDDAARRLSRYFLLQLGLNATFGAFIAIGLWAIGVPSPLLWGIFTALMRFVPYIGSLIAALLPIGLAAAVDPGWDMALLTLALFFISEPIMGHVIEPLVYGQSTGLSPFSVVVSAIFWTWLWGPIGLLIATPLTLCLVVLGRHVERLEFLDVLLGDRPALSPAENLYQRMLAGDPDEALESAEVLLRDRSLTSYYDEVALGGLAAGRQRCQPGRPDPAPARADQDRRRRPDRRSRFPQRRRARQGGDPRRAGRTAPRTRGLRSRSRPFRPRDRRPTGSRRAGRRAAPSCAWRDGVPSTRPPPRCWRSFSRSTASAPGWRRMRPSRVPASRPSTPRASRWSACPTWRSPEPRRICATCCGGCTNGSPGVPVLVGLWPAEEAILKDESLRASIGADVYVTTLREAVLGCLDVATKPAKAVDADGMPVRPEAPKVRMLQAAT